MEHRCVICNTLILKRNRNAKYCRECSYKYHDNKAKQRYDELMEIIDLLRKKYECVELKHIIRQLKKEIVKR